MDESGKNQRIEDLRKCIAFYEGLKKTDPAMFKASCHDIEIERIQKKIRELEGS